MNHGSRDKRKFYRHPIHAPIVVHSNHDTGDLSESIDLSLGGLSFYWPSNLSRGASLRITIPVKEKRFTIDSKVVYSKHDAQTGLFRTGVLFKDLASEFRAKIAEEALEILEYRRHMSAEQGRDVSEEEAARLWIQKYADLFPKTT